MESQHSVRNRLRAAAPEADDRALYEDRLAELAERSVAVDDARALAAVSKRPALDAVLAAIVRAAYGVDNAVRYARSRPLTAVAVAAGLGALLAQLTRRSRRNDRLG